MDGSRIKTFVICLLLAVNLIFLGLVVSDRISSARLQAQIVDDLVTVMGENSVTISPDIIPSGSEAESYPLVRDVSSEEALVRAVIGEAERMDQGGNINYYKSSAGWARFRGNGEFEIIPESPLDAGGVSEADASAALLAEMDVDTLPSFERRREGELSTLTYTCLLDGEPVYDCYISISYSDGALVSVTGRRMIGAPSGSGALVELNPSTALLALLSYIRDSGNVCGEITGLERGYSMTVSVSGDAELVPVWRVATDVGLYYVNPSLSQGRVQIS